MYLLRISLILLASSLATLAAPLPRAIPTPASASTARTYLSELVVAVDSNVPAYSRDLFKTWDTSKFSGSCDTRETVLQRDGTNVVVDSSCAPKSGNWVSPYDNVATTLSSDLDIDHLVPLKEAWVSGARDWTPAQREALANDLVRPQLVAVTDNLNESKGDRDPAQWMPPLSSYKLDSAEKAALTSYLADC